MLIPQEQQWRMPHLSVLILAGAQGMSHPLQGIHKRAGQVIGGVHLQAQGPQLCFCLAQHRVAKGLRGS